MLKQLAWVFVMLSLLSVLIDVIIVTIFRFPNYLIYSTSSIFNILSVMYLFTIFFAIKYEAFIPAWFKYGQLQKSCLFMPLKRSISWGCLFIPLKRSISWGCKKSSTLTKCTISTRPTFHYSVSVMSRVFVQSADNLTCAMSCSAVRASERGWSQSGCGVDMSQTLRCPDAMFKLQEAFFWADT